MSLFSYNYRLAENKITPTTGISENNSFLEGRKKYDVTLNCLSTYQRKKLGSLWGKIVLLSVAKRDSLIACNLVRLLIAVV